MKIKLFIFISILGLALNVHAVDLCEMLLAESPPSGFFALRAQNDSDQTSSLITYLSRLLDETLIGDEHLVRFSEGLERGEVINPILEEEATADFRLAVQRPGLESMIQSEILDHETLLSWVREKISERRIVRQQREVIREDTEISIQLMEFVEIPAGEVLSKGKKRNKKIIFKEPFSMGRYQVTQWQWAMIMGENPSHFSNGSESIGVEINGKFIRMQPNHPVEQVSWDDIQERFLPKLNELSRLDDSLIYAVIPDHPKGKIYRLPNSKEWGKVSGQERRNLGDLFSSKDRRELSKIAWFKDNANGTTHAVGLKLQNVFGFNDMHGNVWEWLGGPLRGSYRDLCGGDWNHDAKTILTGMRINDVTYSRSNYGGFRLVRVDAQ